MLDGPPNRLLASLPEKDRRRLLADCATVELTFGEIICEAGDRIDHVYFPLDSFISQIAPINGHAGLEVGMVGNEGMLGIALMLGVNISPLHALVQGSGRALRLDAALFRREVRDCPSLERELQLYNYVLMSQFAQNAVCTRFHVVEARLARWLLMTEDRMHGGTIHLTHDFLGHMLGVRRVGVTKAATALQKRALIRYNRGEITILDRAGLEAASCDCYLVDQKTYDRILG